MSKAPDAIRKYLTPLQSSDGVPLPRRGHHGSPLMSSPRRITTTHHPAFPAPSQTAAQARAGFQLPASDHYCHLLLHFNIPPLLSPWKSTSRFSSPAVSRSSPPPRWRSKMIDEGWPQPSLIYCYQHTYEAQDRAKMQGWSHCSNRAGKSTKNRTGTVSGTKATLAGSGLFCPRTCDSAASFLRLTYHFHSTLCSPAQPNPVCFYSGQSRQSCSHLPALQSKGD